MLCKYCQAELEEGNPICPDCGKKNKIKNIAKRLKIMKALVFSLISLILVAVLLGTINYGLTGNFIPKSGVLCKTSYSVSKEKLNTPSGNKSFQKTRDDVVATVGEHELTNRMLQIYYWDIVSSSQYADMDKNKPLDQQYQDPDTELTWQMFYIEKAIEAWKRDVMLSDMAKAAGFEMPASYMAQFNSLQSDMTSTATSKGYTSLNTFLENMTGTGTTFDAYYNYLWNYFYGGMYVSEYTKQVEVDMADLEAYYEENQSSLVLDNYFQVTKDSGKLVDVRHILIKPVADVAGSDGKLTGYSDAAWEDCRAKAQAILDEWLAGEATEDTFAALAAKKTEDSGSKSSGGLYTNVWPGKMVEPFNDWCFDESREVGHYGLVKTPYGYHIMFFAGSEEGWIRMCTEGAKSDKATRLLDEMAQQLEVDVNYRKISLADLK